MIIDELLNGVSVCSDDTSAGVFHHRTDDDDEHRIIFRTNTGISILHFSCDGTVKSIDDTEIEELAEEEYAIAICIEEDKRKVVAFSEDGDIVYNPDAATVDIYDLNMVGSYEDLNVLIEDDVEDADVYEALELMECLLF